MCSRLELFLNLNIFTGFFHTENAVRWVGLHSKRLSIESLFLIIFVWSLGYNDLEHLIFLYTVLFCSSPVVCSGVAGRALSCKPVFVGSKASDCRSQSGSNSTIISRSFSNAVPVYSLHSLERVAQSA